MILNKNKKDLLFLRTNDQLAVINNLLPDWRSRPISVISGHVTVDIELNRQGVVFQSVYDVVPVNAFTGCEKEVNELTDIFTDILRRLWPDEPLLAEGLRPNAHTIAQDIIRSRITLDTLLQKLDPGGIIIVSNLNKARVLDVELSSDIFDAMLRIRAGKYGIPVRLIQQPAPVPSLSIRLRQSLGRSFLGPPLRLIIRVASVLKKQLVKAPAVPQKTSRHRIMLIGADFDFEYQIPLTEKLNKSEAMEAVHVFMGGREGWMKPDTYSYIRYYANRSLAFIPMGDFSKELKKVSPGWQEYLSSPCLDFQFKWLFEKAPQNMLQSAAKWTTLFQAYQPDTVILMQDSSYHYADQSVALRRLGIRSVLLPHSAIVNASPSASKFLSQQAFVWGDIMRDELVEIGVAQERLHITGTIKPMQQFVRLDEGKRQEKMLNLGLKPGCRTLVMVTSGSFERWMQPYIDVKMHLASIEAVILYTLRQLDVQLIIKTHPRRDYPAVYIDMVSKLSRDNEQPNKVKVITKDDLYDILPLADAVIVPATHTTASLEALVAEQPMVYIAAARIHEKGFSWARYGGCLIINTIEDIPSSLDRVLNDRGLRERLITEGKGLIKKYYAAEGVKAAYNIQQLLTQIVSKSNTERP
jgi:hypothetical protein